MSRPPALLRLASRPLLCHRSVSRLATTVPPTTAASTRRNLVVLGIETSADDTCAALLRVEGRGANRVAYPLCDERITYANLKHRGIHPGEAVVSHTQHLPKIIQRLIQNSTKPDLVAVTRGPGMGGCLSVGITTAKALAVAWSVPIVGVHHMQAHALTPMMEAAIARGTQNPPKDEDVAEFPFLALLVSGKHTLLVHMKSYTDHRIIASSDTIALGDVLDKCARDILSEHWPASTTTVVYPKEMEQFVADEPEIKDYTPPPETKSGVPKVYTSASHGWSLPPPYRAGSKELHFDFTGFGGHVRKILQQRADEGHMAPPERRELAVQTMKLAYEHVLHKVVLALRTDPDLLAAPPSALVLSGGVSSSPFLRAVARRMLRARGFPGVRVLAPAPRYCTDNAPMIAFAGAQMYEEAGWETDLEFTPRVKWSMDGVLRNVNCWVRRPGFDDVVVDTHSPFPESKTEKGREVVAE